MVHINISDLGAPVQWKEGASTDNTANQNTDKTNLEEAIRKERDEYEEALRKEQEKKNPPKPTEEEIAAAARKGLDGIFDLFDKYDVERRNQERKQREIREKTKQSNLEAAIRKERDELEVGLRKEQEKKTTDIKIKELKNVLELGGIRNALTDSDYLTILSSDNKRERLLELIGTVRELKPTYLGCSSYYYNQETDKIFELENKSIELKTITITAEETLRKLNNI